MIAKIEEGTSADYQHHGNCACSSIHIFGSSPAGVPVHATANRRNNDPRGTQLKQ